MYCTLFLDPRSLFYVDGFFLREGAGFFGLLLIGSGMFGSLQRMDTYNTTSLSVIQMRIQDFSKDAQLLRPNVTDVGKQSPTWSQVFAAGFEGVI